MPMNMTKCPRAGDSELASVVDAPGAAFRVVFSGPNAGREWTRRFVAMAEAHRDDPESLVPELVQYIRELAAAFVSEVVGIAGFAPGSQAEALAALEYLSFSQAQNLVTDILSYQSPKLAQFAGKGA